MDLTKRDGINENVIACLFFLPKPYTKLAWLRVLVEFYDFSVLLYNSLDSMNWFSDKNCDLDEVIWRVSITLIQILQRA